MFAAPCLRLLRLSLKAVKQVCIVTVPEVKAVVSKLNAAFSFSCCDYFTASSVVSVLTQGRCRVAYPSSAGTPV